MHDCDSDYYEYDTFAQHTPKPRPLTIEEEKEVIDSVKEIGSSFAEDDVDYKLLSPIVDEIEEPPEANNLQLALVPPVREKLIRVQNERVYDEMPEYGCVRIEIDKLEIICDA